VLLLLLLLAATAAYLQKHWKKILALVGAGLLLLAVGIIAGYSIGRQSSTAASATAATTSSSSSSSAPGRVRGAALLADGQVLQQLPPPDSDEAKQLLSQPGTPGELFQGTC
jgi:F0F1-type ATP synthase membrane subunit c/vacuolar-type H+-ATPase subunit K